MDILDHHTGFIIAGILVVAFAAALYFTIRAGKRRANARNPQAPPAEGSYLGRSLEGVVICIVVFLFLLIAVWFVSGMPRSFQEKSGLVGNPASAR